MFFNMMLTNQSYTLTLVNVGLIYHYNEFI